MTNTNALTVRPLTPEAWDIIERVSPAAFLCRMFGVANKEQAAMIMLTGHELGLGLAASFQLIHIVQGKPSLSPRGALAIIQNSGELDDLRIQESPGQCTVRMQRGDFSYELQWTMDDAERAGVVRSGAKGDSAWITYPANMLRWRCIGFVADVVFPDLLAGLRRADEYGAEIDPAGDVIAGQWHESPTEPTMATIVASASPPVIPAWNLDDLINRFGGEAVLVANEGRIPGTDEEVAAVAAKLGES